MPNKNDSSKKSKLNPGIVPPYIFEKIDERGNESQRESALRSEAKSEEIRKQRQARGKADSASQESGPDVQNDQ